MTQTVLIDNTVLTNFALVERMELVTDLWPSACTTTAVQAEYAAGTEVRDLSSDAWDGLKLLTLTPTEKAFAARLHQRLGAGERSYIAVAYHRSGLFASDDYDARREGQALQVPTTGTIGVLLLNIQQGRITLADGNRLLAQLIQFGYRSPVNRLDELA